MARLMIPWTWGQEPNEWDPPLKADELDERILAKALWALATQQISESSDERMDRKSARRLSRLGRESSTVKVVSLKRRESHHGDGTSVDWTHRWVVNGHWRRQWLPSAQKHRQVFIASYVKGPDDKPLVLKRRVVKVS